MRKIPWWIWPAVIIGIITANNDWKHYDAPVAWLIGVLIIVVAYYGEKLTNKDR